MQIANGFVTTCPEMKLFMYGITPGEAVMLKTMHNQYSNGTPLTGLMIAGDATEVDEFGKPLQIGERKPFKRLIARMENGTAAMTEIADFETVYTPSTKPRTQTEEANRLRRKYVGNVTVNGKTVSSWEAAFGGGAIVRLPETFEEVRHIIGDVFTEAPKPQATQGITNEENPIIEPQKRLGRPPKVQEPQPA